MRLQLLRLTFGIALAFAGACDTRVDLGDLPACDAQTCPDGCCFEGECVRIPEQDITRCGAAGATCQTCAGGDEATCDQGVCYRSLCGKCAGCCDGTFCTDGSSILGCGRFGQACAQCESDEQCKQGVCSACGPQNCQGCCNRFGECLAGNTDTQCGSGGEACRLCGGFTSCVGNTCQ